MDTVEKMSDGCRSVDSLKRFLQESASKAKASEPRKSDRVHFDARLACSPYDIDEWDE